MPKTRGPSGLPEASKPHLELLVKDGPRGTEYLVGIVDEGRGLGFTVFRFRAPKAEAEPGPPPAFVTAVSTYAVAAGLFAQTGPMGGAVRNEPELWLPSSGTPEPLGVVRRRILAEE